MASLKSSRYYQAYYSHQVRPEGLPIAAIVTENGRRGVKVFPGEAFCRVEFEDGILCPTAKRFSSTSALIRHVRGQHELDIQTWDGRWEGGGAEEKSKGGRPTGQAIAKALVVYKQWDKLIAAEDEAAEETGKQTVNQQLAAESADKALRTSERQCRAKSTQARLDHEAAKNAESIRLNAKYYFQRPNTDRWPLNPRRNDAHKKDAYRLLKEDYPDNVEREGSIRCAVGCNDCRGAGYDQCNFNFHNCIYVQRFGFLKAALAAYAFDKELYEGPPEDSVPEGWEGVE